MGTPLKQIRLLLSPKLLSPRSPVINRPNCEPRNVAKKLDFSRVPCKNIAEHGVKINVIKCESPTYPVNAFPSVLNSRRLQFKCLESAVPTEDDLLFLNSALGVETKRSNNNNNLLLVNTPNKLDILKYGLSGKDYNVLGRGSFGTVVRGLYKGQDVAVKVVKTKPKLNEANALKLRHENIIEIKDVIMRNEKHSIIIMEFLKSSVHLQTVINNESFALDWGKIIQFSVGICDGLMYCHGNGVLHLDLKPLNILLCNDNCCKICDFGSSRIVGEIEPDYTHEGTVAYTAPEILIGNKPTFASDIYSIGIILWQLRYRETPFSTFFNKDGIIYKVVKYGLRPTLIDRTEILDDFSVLYKTCWSEVVTERPTLSAIINKLRAL